jgi:hypothetical protein
MSGPHLIETLSGAGSGLAGVLAERAEILGLSQAEP